MGDRATRSEVSIAMTGNTGILLANNLLGAVVGPFEAARKVHLVGALVPDISPYAIAVAVGGDLRVTHNSLHRRNCSMDIRDWCCPVHG